MTPPLIIFDLDGTLAESKQAVTPEMAALLARLLAETYVGIISGGALQQFLKQVVDRLSGEADKSKLYLLPTSGASLYEYRGCDWRKVYEERLTEEEMRTIAAAMRVAASETHAIDFSAPAYGERIEYRGGQVTLSALGQHAPLDKKLLWDPTRAKREALRAAIAPQLPGFSVKIGGKTSVDITKQGVDKAYGIHQLCERLGIKESAALYVGDELGPGGNDEAVYKTDAKTKAVKDPSETAKFIVSLLA